MATSKITNNPRFIQRKTITAKIGSDTGKAKIYLPEGFHSAYFIIASTNGSIYNEYRVLLNPSGAQVVNEIATSPVNVKLTFSYTNSNREFLIENSGNYGTELIIVSNFGL